LCWWRGGSGVGGDRWNRRIIESVMETDVVCPDCGRVIAPRGSIAEAMRCRCNDGKGASVATAAALDAEVAAAGASAAKGEKSCYICGASLAGRVRLKDNLGRYWCKQCASADKRAKRHEEKGRCADCSRVFPPAKLTFFQNAKICPGCFKAREKALEKKVKKQAAETIHTKHERRTLLWMTIAVVVLLALGALSHYLKII
jgi:hypothetical protein